MFLYPYQIHSSHYTAKIDIWLLTKNFRNCIGKMLVKQADLLKVSFYFNGFSGIHDGALLVKSIFNFFIDIFCAPFS